MQLCKPHQLSVFIGHSLWAPDRCNCGDAAQSFQRDCCNHLTIYLSSEHSRTVFIASVAKSCTISILILHGDSPSGGRGASYSIWACGGAASRRRGQECTRRQAEGAGRNSPIVRLRGRREAVVELEGSGGGGGRRRRRRRRRRRHRRAHRLGTPGDAARRCVSHVTQPVSHVTCQAARRRPAEGGAHAKLGALGWH